MKFFRKKTLEKIKSPNRLSILINRFKQQGSFKKLEEEFFESSLANDKKTFSKYEFFKPPSTRSESEEYT